MKKRIITLVAFLFLLSNITVANDDFVIVEGERRVFVRLEFEVDRVALTPASAAVFDNVTPQFTDGTMRRYEIHGNFCAGVEGSRRNALFRTEAVFEKLIERGVSEAYITSTINVATHGRDQTDVFGCAPERRVDIMSIDLRRELRNPVVQITPAAPPLHTHVEPHDVETRHALSLPELPESQFVPEPTRAAPPPPAEQGRRTVAVYMAGDEPQAVRGVHNILGGELVRVISANENFIAVDRTDFILAALEDEHEYQRSGMVDDEQIKDLGRQLGVEFMCISNIISVGSGYYIDTRLVDVVTAEVIRSITATSSLRDANEKMRVARDVANELVDPDRENRCGHGEDTRYDPAHQFCFGGRAYNFCGGSGYNPQTQGCLPNLEIGTLCANGTIVTLGTHCGDHTLSVAVAPANGGSIIRAPDAQTYRADATVALSAVANRGFTFAGWAGAQTSSEQSINITMTRNMPVIAMFRPENNNALITTAFPNNGGRITRSPESDVYQSGEVVSVTATPNRGFEFVGWEGAQTSSNATINIMMNEGKALVAIFRPNLHTFNAVAMPEFGGSVFINGTALSSASTSEFGNLVEAFARPAPGYVFTGWTGAAFGMENPVIVDLSFSNINVTANFAPRVTDSESESRVIAVGGSSAAVAAVASVARSRRQTSGGRQATSVAVSPIIEGTFTDLRDGQTYRVVTIGNQTWMAQNLNYHPPVGNSWCYQNRASNCETFGRLYDWNTAMAGAASSVSSPSGVQGVCPAGWHLPSDVEWAELADAIGSNAGTKLKSASGWRSHRRNPVGTNDFGFSALPGGSRWDGRFSYVNIHGYWWSATEIGPNNAWGRQIRYDLEDIYPDTNDKSDGFSVRCVMD